MAAGDRVLVTGAYGLVGRPTVRQLVADGFKVVATAHHAVKPELPAAVEVHPLDLTKPDQVAAVVADVRPSAIVHLAACIPPMCYANRTLARAVNVDATAALVRAAQTMPSPPRFVHASSMAVYGSRNPHRCNDLLTTDTPTAASDLYGCHKLESENVVRSSDLEWSILRLSGVNTLEPLVDYGDLDWLYFGAVMPVDNRCHYVDARDAATAFAAAVTTDAVREIFVIGGDESNKRVVSDSAESNVAIGTGALVVPGLPGDPESDVDWYPLDWMDTSRSQQVLKYQRYSWSDSIEEMRARASGWKSRALRIAAPLMARRMRKRAPYYNYPGRYADPWGRIRDRWGDPAPDSGAIVR